MAHNTLSRRALDSKTNVVRKVVGDFEGCGYATYFYLGIHEGPIHYGSKAIEEHVTNHMEELMSHPQYRPAQRDPNADESARVIHEIEILRANLKKTEAKMKMMELRQYAVNLMRKVVPVGTKNLYTNKDNKPEWFPASLEWKHPNEFKDHELRPIISACYNHFNLHIPVTPDPSQPVSASKRKRIQEQFRQFEERMSQGTQTSPEPSLHTHQTVAQQTSPLATPSPPFEPQPIPSRLPGAPSYKSSSSSTEELPILHPVSANEDVQQTGSSTFTTLQTMSVDTTAFPPRPICGTPSSTPLEPRPEHPSVLATLRRTRQGKGKGPNPFL